ncbi:hypothetical protein OK016_21215 [Vibrio chagasii]|nr:hypothetical protein [Vibrio chagasii]
MLKQVIQKRESPISCFLLLNSVFTHWLKASENRQCIAVFSFLYRGDDSLAT